MKKRSIHSTIIEKYLLSADKKLTAQIKTILKIDDFKVGELVLCRMLSASSTLELRFYAGNGEVYINQKKFGTNKTIPIQILKFDPNNLPPELKNESN